MLLEVVEKGDSIAAGACAWIGAWTDDVVERRLLFFFYILSPKLQPNTSRLVETKGSL